MVSLLLAHCGMDVLSLAVWKDMWSVDKSVLVSQARLLCVPVHSSQVYI